MLRLPMLLWLLLRWLSTEKVLLEIDRRHSVVATVVAAVDVELTTWPFRAKLTKVKHRKGLIESFEYLISFSYQFSFYLILLCVTLAILILCNLYAFIVKDVENCSDIKSTLY